MRQQSVTISQRQMIEKLAEQLKMVVAIPVSRSEADFVIDDLRHRERVARRARAREA